MLDILIKLAVHTAITAFLSCLVVWSVGLTKALLDKPSKETRWCTPIDMIKDMAAFGATLFALVFLVIAAAVSLLATGWLAWEYCLMIV